MDTQQFTTSTDRQGNMNQASNNEEKLSKAQMFLGLLGTDLKLIKHIEKKLDALGKLTLEIEVLNDKKKSIRDEMVTKNIPRTVVKMFEKFYSKSDAEIKDEVTILFGVLKAMGKTDQLDMFLSSQEMKH